MSLIEHNDSLSSRIAGLSESLECGDGGVRGDFRAALAEVDALEAQVANLRGAVDRIKALPEESGLTEPDEDDPEAAAFARGYRSGVTDAIERLGGQ
jgi:hypothetical protein